MSLEYKINAPVSTDQFIEVQGGVGKKLQMLMQEQLGPKCKLILVAAPAATAYYEHLGFTNNPRCWVLARQQTIRS